ncbi:hypothetical protein ACJIZ3_008861 [Penstemon smallii]|uniref:Uncharacterized protein n=1 Tax=Penstemon smallii TaxID=265156 RepID=A0ABD3TAZ0_9LAMI
MLDQHEETMVPESARRGKRIRIDDDDHPSELHSNDVDNAVHDNTGDAKERKPTRGPTHMARVWVRRGRKEVEFNEFGQAIGPNKSEYVEFIGTLVRNSDLLPLDIEDWHNVSRNIKKTLVEQVKVTLNNFLIFLSYLPFEYFISWNYLIAY